MQAGNFYYITDEYYDKFKNCNLMGNKDEDEFGKHGCPCYYCFEQLGFYWMVPISSKVEKYKQLYDEKKVLRYYKDRGIKIVLTDLDTILSGLNKDS